MLSRCEHGLAFQRLCPLDLLHNAVLNKCLPYKCVKIVINSDYVVRKEKI